MPECDEQMLVSEFPEKAGFFFQGSKWLQKHTPRFIKTCKKGSLVT
jgi:hypothetical protein